MNDPCGADALACTYAGGFSCGTVATCRGAHWKISYKTNGFCNPPQVCADDEPVDVENASCKIGMIQGAERCRYDHGGCFVYLTCDSTEAGNRWRPTTNGENTCDSCCPLARPAVGDACANPGILCPGSAGDVVCRDGVWTARTPLSGSGGSSGAAGGAGSGGGGAGGSAVASCSNDPPPMNEPCVAGLACEITSGCAKITTSCVAGRVQNVWSSTGEPGCVERPDCPLVEPTDAATAACAAGTGSVYEQSCRYPHGSCYRYLECGGEGDPRWHAPTFASAADSCCPDLQPAVGATCDDDGALCSWASLCNPGAPRTELTCKAGTWQAPSP